MNFCHFSENLPYFLRSDTNKIYIITIKKSNPALENHRDRCYDKKKNIHTLLWKEHLKMKKLTTILASMAALFCAAALTGSELKIKNGESLAFLGDSITQQGWTNPYGYLHLVGTALKSKGVEIKIIPAGISGHKSTNMNARMERDVVKKNPVWMTLSCGVNDVWHGARGVKLEDYKKNIRQIVDKALAANIQVYIMTSTMVTENPKHKNNLKLDEYNKFLKELAAEKKLPLVDLNAAMKKVLADTQKAYPGVKTNFLTVDGVHMGPLGNMMMAGTILKSFGFSDVEMKKALTEWLKLNWTVRGMGTFTVKEYFTIETKLWTQKKTMSSYVNEKLRELLR